MAAFQSKTLLEIREAVGRNCGCLTLGTTTSQEGAGGDTSSLIDTYALSKYGDDGVNGRQVLITGTVTGGAAVGEKSFVSDFNGTNKDATLSPALSAAVKTGQSYEMWEDFSVEDAEGFIGEAISDVTGEAYVHVTDISLATLPDVYEYSLPSGVVGVYKILYESDCTEVEIEDGEAVWDELVDGDVTAVLDTSLFPGGGSSVKLTVAAGCGAGDILATQAITALDISGYDKVSLELYSSVALAEGDLTIMLDNTAACASPVEEIDIPVTTAGIWAYHTVSLANPLSDTAIISVGLKMVTDKGAFVLAIRKIRARLSTSSKWVEIHPDYWKIDQGLGKLILSSEVFGEADEETPLRLKGYKNPSLLDDDTDTADIDPAYIIAAATAKLMASGIIAPEFDTKARTTRLQYWQTIAEGLRRKIKTSVRQGTRWA